jgi:YHS domain-containing protein
MFLFAAILSISTWAATPINTVGSDDGTAISGFDSVAFFKSNKAIPGDPKYSTEYEGAKWIFSSAENLKEFQAKPELFVPAWGGHCASAVSDKQISRKKLSGDFEIIDGKLYLFSYGNNRKSGARDDFLFGRYSKVARLRDGDKAWPEIKLKLEDGSISQPDSKSYKKSPYE